MNLMTRCSFCNLPHKSAIWLFHVCIICYWLCFRTRHEKERELESMLKNQEDEAEKLKSENKVVSCLPLNITFCLQRGSIMLEFQLNISRILLLTECGPTKIIKIS